MSKPSMRQVANLAQVSIQTVSRVINQPHLVREETRERVEAVIRAVGYTPNATARSLRSNKSRAVGIILNGGSLFGPSSVAPILTYRIQQQGLATLTATFFNDDVKNARVAMNDLLARNVDALVVIAAHKWVADEIVSLAHSYPVVAVTSEELGPDIFRVAVDQEETMRLLVEHFVALSKERICFLAGPDNWLDAAARRDSWNRLTSEYEIQDSICEVKSFYPDEAYLAVADYFGANQLPQALLCANDMLAMGAMRLCWEKRIKIPTDIMVAGIDDTISASYLTPSLTSVTQPLDEVVDCILDLLVAALNEEPARVKLVKPELVIRESTSVSGLPHTKTLPDLA